jgi:hypothetical protein
MADVPRVEPSEVMKKQGSGRKMWMVCAYDDEAKCTQLRIDSALTMSQFTAQVPSLSREEEIVFYCA